MKNLVVRKNVVGCFLALYLVMVLVCMAFVIIPWVFSPWSGGMPWEISLSILLVAATPFVVLVGASQLG